MFPSSIINTNNYYYKLKTNNLMFNEMVSVIFCVWKIGGAFRVVSTAAVKTCNQERTELYFEDTIKN